MTLLLIFSALTLAVVAFLLLPLLRPQTAAPDRLGFDLAVYRDQLAEAVRDQARGLLSPEQGQQARAEIERRMLAADARPAAPASVRAREIGRRLRLGAGLVIVAGLPLAAFAIYDVLGSPALPSQPFAERKAQQTEQMAGIRVMVERLAARLEQSPDDVEGWTRLATALRVMGDTGRAKYAALHVVALRPDKVEPLLLLGEIQLAEADGNALPSDFVATMEKVLALDGGNVQALYYLGVADAEAGNIPSARARWTRLLAVLPQDSPDRAQLQKELDALSGR